MDFNRSSINTINMKINLLFYSVIFTLLSVIVLTFINNVSSTVTDEDRLYLEKLIGVYNTNNIHEDFISEINFIENIQKKILEYAPYGEGIAQNTAREPRDLYFAKSGECFDRSRVLEKAFKQYGFKTRHASFFLKKGMKSALDILFVPSSNIKTHAITEVLTQKGWLVVGTNSTWIAVDRNLRPYDAKQINLNLDNRIQVDWREPPTYMMADFYLTPTIVIYGLYSRHGKFYPPYWPIPDINLNEIGYNLF